MDYSWRSPSSGRWDRSCSIVVYCTAQILSLKVKIKSQTCNIHLIIIYQHFLCVVFNYKSMWYYFIWQQKMKMCFFFSFIGTCFLAKLFCFGFREWGHLVTLCMTVGMLESMEVHTLAVNHQVWKLPGKFRFLQRREKWQKDWATCRMLLMPRVNIGRSLFVCFGRYLINTF